MKKYNKKVHLYSTKSEDYTERESKELNEIRKENNKSFVKSMRGVIASQGYISPMS